MKSLPTLPFIYKQLIHYFKKLQNILFLYIYISSKPIHVALKFAKNALLNSNTINKNIFAIQACIVLLQLEPRI